MTLERDSEEAEMSRQEEMHWDHELRLCWTGVDEICDPPDGVSFTLPYH